MVNFLPGMFLRDFKRLSELYNTKMAMAVCQRGAKLRIIFYIVAVVLSTVIHFIDIALKTERSIFYLVLPYLVLHNTACNNTRKDYHDP